MSKICYVDSTAKLARSEVVSGDEILCFLSERREARALSVYVLLRGKQEKGRELFLHLLLLSYLHLKRILRPKWRIWG